MSIMYGDRNFLEENKFMRLPDGRIAFFTEKKTWRDVLKHGLLLDDYFDRQTYTPKISFEFKTSTRRQRKHKEGLNDEDRCDMCHYPLDTMTFVTRQGRKKVYCSECCIHEYGYDQIQDHVLIMQNHIQDINAVLHLLDARWPVVSVVYFHIHLKYLVDAWKSYIGNEVIRRIFVMMKEWNPYGDANILKLLEELRLLKKLLTNEINFLNNILQEDEPW